MRNPAAVFAIAVSLAGCGGTTMFPIAKVSDAQAPPAAKSGGEAEILVTNYAAGLPTTAVVFAKGARGNATPLRQFATKTPAFGIRTDGSYWSGPYYANNSIYSGGLVERHVNGKVANKIVGTAYEPIREASTDRNGDLLLSEWAQETYGGGCNLYAGNLRIYSAARSFKLTRSIDAGGLCTNVVYTDGKGDIYVGYDQYDYYYPSEYSAAIVEAGPQSTSIDPPVRSISLGSPYSTIQCLGTDTHGNLFALANGQLFEYGPGKTTGHFVLKGVPITSFAIDSKNDLYVVVGTYIEEFAPGTARPLRVIGGPATGLTNPAGISIAD